MIAHVRKRGNFYVLFEGRPEDRGEGTAVLGEYYTRRQALRHAKRNGHDVVIRGRNNDTEERKDMMNYLNVHICTDEMINSGRLNGEWLHLPTSRSEIDFAVSKIGMKNGECGVDYHIVEFESDLPVIAKLPIDHIRRKSLDELNEIAGMLERYDPRLVVEFNAAMENLVEKYGGRDGFDSSYLSKRPLGSHPGSPAAAQRGTAQPAAAGGAGHSAVRCDPSGLQYENMMLFDGGAAQRYGVRASRGMDAARRRGVDSPDGAFSSKPDWRKPITTYDKVKQTLKELEEGIKGVFESDKYKVYLDTLSKFHSYSFSNCMLIAMQRPDATHVAGFNFWRDCMNKPVKRGEKGIRILAPSSYRAMREVERAGKDGKPVLDSNGHPVSHMAEVTVPCFKTVSVFDVSQTGGPPLPTLGVDELTGGVDKYRDLFEALEKTSPVPISFGEVSGDAKGSFNMESKRITIREGMSELHNLKTMIHEIAHSRLHDRDTNNTQTEKQADRHTREIEAESIAYTVCARYGLDTSDYSFGYIAEWGGDKDMAQLKASLGVIRKEANAIIEETDKHLLGIREQRAGQLEAERDAEAADKPDATELTDRAEDTSAADRPVTADRADMPPVNDMAVNLDTKVTTIKTADKPSAKTKAGKQPQTKTSDKKPSIRDTLAEAKKQAAKQNAQRSKAKEKVNEAEL